MSQLKDRPGDGTLRLSQRGEIRLGFRCNARCGFCYYQDLLDNPKDKEPTTGQLKRQLQVLRDWAPARWNSPAESRRSART